MKKVILLLIFFTSCTNYYCLVNTQSINAKKVNSHFIYENDTIIIRYYFWADRGEMSFSVYNKLKVPLFIDWKNSSFIINGASYKYWQDVENSTSTSTGVNYYGLQTLTGIPVSVHKGVQNSTVQRPERIISVPPQSEIKQNKFSIIAYGHYITPNDTGIVFNNDNSPVKFRNYIVLSTSENLTNLFYVDNQFYVSKFTLIASNKFISEDTKSYNYLSPDCFFFHIEKQN